DYKSAATMSTRRVADLPFGPVVRPRRADGRGLSLQRSALDLRTYHIGAEGEQGDVERGEKRDERLHGKPYVWSVRAGGGTGGAGGAEDVVPWPGPQEEAAGGGANGGQLSPPEAAPARHAGQEGPARPAAPPPALPTAGPPLPAPGRDHGRRGPPPRRAGRAG